MVRNDTPNACADNTVSYIEPKCKDADAVRENLLKAYDIIGSLTPLATDCGELCGKACCSPDEDGQGGMLLFPGERALCEGGWCRIDSAPEGDILTCLAPCPRDARPLACRIFPLTPVFSKGVWTVRMDARARRMCPLVRSGVKGLDREFALAVRDALRIIASTPEGESFLQDWQAAEEEFRSFTL